MRKLLVASQKGGVGKTTTSINLATGTALAGTRVLLLDADPLSSISTSLNLMQHPNRKTLRDAGLDLPGMLVTNVVPGLDVLSPYGEGGCTDENLDSLLAILNHPIFQKTYGCLIVDTPPFLGAKPAQLLNTCDQYVLVMRAEPMAYRTLPAFLELIQRSRKAGHDIQMRGILLTLPDGEGPGGRWERELRGRFGTRILPQVIPHDEEITKAQVFGQPVAQSAPESQAAEQYQCLVESLSLTQEGRSQEETRSPFAPFIAAAAAIKQAAAAVPRRSGNVVPTRAVTQAMISLPSDSVADIVLAKQRDDAYDAEAPPLDIKTPMAPMRLLSAANIPVISSDILPRSLRGAPRPAPRGAPPARPAPPRPNRPTLAPQAAKPAEKSPEPAGSPSNGVPPPLLWSGVVGAIVIGVALQRMPHLMAPMIPYLIGLGVAGAVLALFKVLTSPATVAEAARAAAPSAPPAPAKPATVLPPGPRKSFEAKPAPAMTRKEPSSSRMNTGRRQPGTSHRRDLNGR